MFRFHVKRKDQIYLLDSTSKGHRINSEIPIHNRFMVFNVCLVAFYIKVKTISYIYIYIYISFSVKADNKHRIKPLVLYLGSSCKNGFKCIISFLLEKAQNCTEKPFLLTHKCLVSHKWDINYLHAG